MKRFFAVLCGLNLCLGVLLTGCGNNNTNNSTSENQADFMSGKHHICIDVSNYGTIEVELDADTAPITVTNFINLANSGFYNGLTFHRVIDGFMIQDGVQKNISHVRGTISMARSSANNSASSQFFIMQKDTPSLDGQYAAFGTVTNGMDIVDKICKDCTDTNQNGVITDKSKQPVISAVRVVD